jgi:PAS domain S-box-containing protein
MNKKYKSLLEAIPDLMMVLDKDGFHLEIIPPKDGSLLIPVEKLLGKSIKELEVLDENVKNIISENITKTLSEQKVQTFEYNVLNEFFEARMSPLDEEKVMVLVRKVTDNVVYQKELKENTNKLLNIIKNIDEVVYSVAIDKNGNRKITYVSPIIEEIFGLSVDEYITLVKSGKLIKKVHPDDKKMLMDAAKKLTETYSPQEYTYRFKFGKEWRWIEEKVFPKLDENGIHIGNLGIVRDVYQQIKGRQRFEQELLIKEEKYRTLFDSANIGVQIHDALTGKIIEANKKALELSGFTDVSQYKTVDIWHEDPYSFEYAMYNLSMAKKKGSYRFEWKTKKISGETIWTDVSLKRVKIEGKDRILAMVVEITDKKLFEEKLKESENKYKVLFSKANDGIVILKSGIR